MLLCVPMDCLPMRVNHLTKPLAAALLAMSLASCSFAGFARTGREADDTEKPAAWHLGDFVKGNAIVPPASANYFDFMLGELAFKDEKYDEALEYFQAAEKTEVQPSPTLHIRLAQMHLRTGNLEDALKEVNLGLSGNRDNLDLLRLKAGILAALKRNLEAIEVYQRIIELSPGVVEDPYILTASLYAQDSNWPEAKAALLKLLERKPGSFIGTYYLAKIAVASGSLAEAADYYRKALVISPKAEAVELDLARVYALQKKYDQAIKITEELIKRNPGNAKARSLRGDLLLGAERTDDALNEFEALGKIESDSSQTRIKIALIKLQRRDYQGAENDLQLILSEHPDNTVARYYLASTYAGMEKKELAVQQVRLIPPGKEFFLEGGILAVYLLREDKKIPEALQIMDSLLQTRPDNVKLLSLKAMLEHDAKNWAAAVKDIKRVIELAPKSDEHYFNLGVNADDAGDKKEAVKAMKKAIELNPKNAAALNYLGYSYAEQGKNLPEALELINRALAIEPENGYYLDSLGWVYFQMGRFEDACRDLRRAAQLTHEDAVILEHYARALFRTGKNAEALEIVEKALKLAPESDDKNVGERLKKLQQEIKKAGH